MKPTYLLRASDPHRPLWWTRTGWQPDRAAAERFESRGAAEGTRADITSDHDVQIVRAVGTGRRA